MTEYTYDPDAWHPAVAGLVAGAIAAIVAALVSLPLRSPDEIVANSLTVVLVSLALGVVAGMLWRRIRASAHPRRLFGWAMAGGWFVAMLAVTIVDQTTLSNLVPYAAPLAAIIFITLGFLTPLLSGLTSSMWLGAIPVAIAVALGIGLFGRGNVASGELGLDDLPVASTTTTVAAATGSTEATTTTVRALEGALSIPEDLAPSYTVSTGLATYSVEETLRGLATVAVGTTESITGSIIPAGPFSFTIDLQSFVSDQSQRDGRVRGWFAEHPEGVFSGDEFGLPPEAAVGEVVAFDVTGDMTINDITMPVTWSIEARIEEDATLSITGETFIVLSDFDVPVFTGGFVEMEDGATLEVVFSAGPEG